MSFSENFLWGAASAAAQIGLIHVDYRTQKRTIKDSARYYAEIIRTNGGTL